MINNAVEVNIIGNTNERRTALQKINKITRYTTSRVATMKANIVPIVLNNPRGRSSQIVIVFFCFKFH